MPVLYYSMTADGPVVDAFIGVSAPRWQVLQQANQPIPQAIPARMLLDTGASGCVVNVGLLAPLGLTPSGTIQMHTPTTGGVAVQSFQFDVGLMISNPHAPQAPFWVPIIPIAECQPLVGNIQGLIGRDVLSMFLLVYYGQANAFTLAF